MSDIKDAGYGLMEYPKLSRAEVEAILNTVGRPITEADIRALCNTALALWDELTRTRSEFLNNMELTDERTRRWEIRFDELAVERDRLLHENEIQKQTLAEIEQRMTSLITRGSIGG